MTRLLDLVPPRWRSRELEAGIVRAVGRPLDELRGAVLTRTRHLDPDGAPEGWLDWLMWVAALPRNDALSPRRKRNLLRIAGRIWAEKGTRASLETWVRAVAGASATVTNLNRHVFIAGLALSGDVCGPGVNAWRYEIAIDPTVITAAELRALLRPVAPAVCQARIVDLSSNLLSDFA